MLRIKENNLDKLKDFNFEDEGKEICFWNHGIKKIIIHKSDSRIRFNCMDLQSYDVLFDLITNNMVEKVGYYKIPYNARYLELENRIKILEEKLNEKV